MEKIKRTTIKEILSSPEKYTGTVVDVKGWVRTRRGNKNVRFVALNDGTTIKNLQIVFDLARFPDEILKPVTTGASIHVQGELVAASSGAGQLVEGAGGRYGGVRHCRSRHISAAEEGAYPRIPPRERI